MAPKSKLVGWIVRKTEELQKAKNSRRKNQHLAGIWSTPYAPSLKSAGLETKHSATPTGFGGTCGFLSNPFATTPVHVFSKQHFLADSPPLGGFKQTHHHEGTWLNGQKGGRKPNRFRAPNPSTPFRLRLTNISRIQRDSFQIFLNPSQRLSPKSGEDST